MFSPPQDNNCPDFNLSMEKGKLHPTEEEKLHPNKKEDEKEHFRLTISLLTNEGGKLAAKTYKFDIAPSRWVTDPHLSIKDKHLVLQWPSAVSTQWDGGPIGASNLIFTRREIEDVPLEQLRNGDFGGVRMALSLTMGTDASMVKLVENQRRRKVLSQAVINRLEKPEETATVFEHPFCVLAAHQGCNVTIALTLAQVGGDAPKEDAWLMATILPGNVPVWHCASAMARLPGEPPEESEWAIRARYEDLLWEAKRQLGSLSSLGYAYRKVMKDKTFAEGIEKLVDINTKRLDSVPLCMHLPEGGWIPPICYDVATSPDQRERALRELYNSLERQVGQTFAQWRRLGKPGNQPRALEEPYQRWAMRVACGGKSLWAIEHKERVLKLIQSWHRHQRPWAPKIRRYNRRVQGQVGRNLQEHIVRLRDDRSKTAADLVVQAARGYLYEDGTWQKRWAESEIICLEKWPTFLPRDSRPKAENTKLRDWSHRGVYQNVKQQAEVHGIATTDTQGSYDSQFDARSGTAGLRCRRITRASAKVLCDPEAPDAIRLTDFLGVDVPKALKKAAVKWERISPIPFDDGEFLGTRTLGGPRIVHADINAAQNLLIRYVTGHHTPWRVRARKINNDLYVILIGTSVRLRGSLGMAAVLDRVEAGSERFTLRSWPTYTEAAAATGLSRRVLGEPGGDEEEAGEDGTSVTFFHDRSGAVLGRTGLWAPADAFWSAVEASVVDTLGLSRVAVPT